MKPYFSDNEQILRCITENLGWTDEDQIHNLIRHFELSTGDPTRIAKELLYATFHNWLQYVTKYSDTTQLYRVTANNLVLSLPAPTDDDEVPVEQGANIIQGNFRK